MADITMCQNENCKLKEDCYRYTALAAKEQRYILIEKEVKNAIECEYYWDNGK